MNSIKKYLPKITLSILMVMAFAMPIHLRIMPILIILFVVFNLIDGIINRTFVFNNKKFVILGILFYLVHIISVSYSKYRGAAWFDMEVKLSLIVFPLIFLFKNPLIINRKKWVLYSFVVGSIVSSIIMLLFAYSRFDGRNSYVFYYAELGLFHPSYMSMYFIFAILIIIRMIDKDIKELSTRVIAYITIVFLLVLIFQLQSKAGILSIIFISIYYLVFAFIRSNPILLRTSFLVLAVSLSLIFIQKESRLQSMAKSVKTIKKEGHTSGSTGVRYSMWVITSQDLKNHWLTGVGAGDIKPELFKIYQEKGLTEAIKGNFNIHNQYLETFYGQGIAGISLLLLLLFMGLREALKRKELILSGFIILITLSFGPESMLNSQMGVVFFSFFYYFLFSFTLDTKKLQSY